VLFCVLSVGVVWVRVVLVGLGVWGVWLLGGVVWGGWVLFAVGAGHLAGEGSVQDQLRHRRVKVKRVWQ
jgi:hypothetical protein